MEAAKHNRIHGYSLAVVVIDHLRAEKASGKVVTVWSMSKDIAKAYNLDTDQADRLRRRLRHLVRQLDSTETVKTRKEWNSTNQVFNLIIEPCSAT